jgi:hypothetical protein
MNERLKRIIFKKLDQDLGHAEIIVDYNTSIWFIDRTNKYWYLELEKSGHLWWRYSFFEDFFPLFGMEREEYEPVITEWVEEVLKRKVVSTKSFSSQNGLKVEEVLKRGVSSTRNRKNRILREVEEVLKRKVVSTSRAEYTSHLPVEEVLNNKL